MAYIAQCLGLRVSEIVALRWDDFDFEKNQLLVQRSIVNGQVDDVKTRILSGLCSVCFKDEAIPLPYKRLSRLGRTFSIPSLRLVAPKATFQHPPLLSPNCEILSKEREERRETVWSMRDAGDVLVPTSHGPTGTIFKSEDPLKTD